MGHKIPNVLPKPPRGTMDPADWEDWATRLVRKLEMIQRETQAPHTATGIYNVATGLTFNRSITATYTATEVREFAASLARDLQEKSFIP